MRHSTEWGLVHESTWQDLFLSWNMGRLCENSVSWAFLAIEACDIQEGLEHRGNSLKETTPCKWCSRLNKPERLNTLIIEIAFSSEKGDEGCKEAQPSLVRHIWFAAQVSWGTRWCHQDRLHRSRPGRAERCRTSCLSLEVGRGIVEIEWHYGILEQVADTEGGFPYHPWGNATVMIGRSRLNFVKIVHPPVISILFLSAEAGSNILQ